MDDTQRKHEILTNAGIKHPQLRQWVIEEFVKLDEGKDREVEAKALEVAAAVTYVHTMTDHRNKQTKSDRFVFSKEVRDHLVARAAALRSTPATDPEPTETNGEQRG